MKSSFQPRAKQISTTTKKKWNNFREKKLRAINDDISLVVVTHLFIETLLNEFLSLVLLNGADLEKEKFSTKVNILEATGCIEKKEIVDGIREINKIRNKLAHNMDYQLTRKDLSTLPGKGKARGRTNVQKFRSYVLYLIGYLSATKDVWELAPYFMTVKQHHLLLGRDPGFSLDTIQKEYLTNHAEHLVSALESMKIKE